VNWEVRAPTSPYPLVGAGCVVPSRFFAEGEGDFLGWVLPLEFHQVLLFNPFGVFDLSVRPIDD